MDWYSTLVSSTTPTTIRVDKVVVYPKGEEVYVDARIGWLRDRFKATFVENRLTQLHHLHGLDVGDEVARVLQERVADLVVGYEFTCELRVERRLNYAYTAHSDRKGRLFLPVYLHCGHATAGLRVSLDLCGFGKIRGQFKSDTRGEYELRNVVRSRIEEIRRNVGYPVDIYAMRDRVLDLDPDWKGPYRIQHDSDPEFLIHPPSKERQTLYPTYASAVLAYHAQVTSTPLFA